MARETLPRPRMRILRGPPKKTEQKIMTPTTAEAWRRARLAAQLRAGKPREAVRVAMGDGILLCEISKTTADLSLGLAGRSGLAWDNGMLFLYPPTTGRAFWMKGCKIPLDIAFISRGKITGIYPLEPFSEERVGSLGPSNGAIEACRGWFHERHVRVGDEISIARVLPA